MVCIYKTGVLDYYFRGKLVPAVNILICFEESRMDPDIRRRFLESHEAIRTFFTVFHVA